MYLKNLTGISVFTLFAAATLCAEETDTGTAPELGGATSAAVRALIHIIGDAVKIEAKLQHIPLGRSLYRVWLLCRP